MFNVHDDDEETLNFADESEWMDGPESDEPGHVPEYHLQFCDREANQDITSSLTAERDATEVRLWSADSTCIVAAEKNSRSGMWHVSASDVYNWTPKARKAWPSWQEAMCSLGDETRDAMDKADR